MSSNVPSMRAYLIRAIHEWCSDNLFTPLLLVKVNGQVSVPVEFVKDGEIILNVSYDATSALQITNEWVEFKARFGGTARPVQVPIVNIAAIYARENGQGMAFPVEAAQLTSTSALKNDFLGNTKKVDTSKFAVVASQDAFDAINTLDKTTATQRPVLTRVK